VDRCVDAAARLVELVLVALMAAMVLLVFGNVVLRYGFNAGITVSEELSRWFFVWMTFLGAAVGLKERAHLGTDLLIGRLGPGGRRVCLAVARLLMLGCTVLVLAGSWTQWRINLDAEAPVTGLSMAWLTTAGLVFAALTLPLLLRDLWRTLSGHPEAVDGPMTRDAEESASAAPPSRPGGGAP
jgi:TRAP-type C4-dicarboxylate transport system permease small subunit